MISTDIIVDMSTSALVWFPDYYNPMVGKGRKRGQNVPKSEFLQLLNFEGIFWKGWNLSVMKIHI